VTQQPPRLLHSFAKPAAPAASFLKVVRGAGALVWDENGNEYVDALGSLWYCQVGHGRREIVDAITKQALTLAGYHTFDRFTNEPADRLAERLHDIAPMADSRIFFTSSGSEAVESALKLTRIAHFVAGEPQRTLVISRRPSYHGVTYGGTAATGLPLNQQGFGPLLPDVVQVAADDLDELDAVLSENEGRLAAIIAEPVIGAGGVLPPKPGYLDALRERATQHGGLLILDEVICAFGRLGRWWGGEHYGVTPDMATFAKGVTSGYQPLGGVVVGPKVRERLEADPNFVLRHGHTYSGHPTACAAALANLDFVEPLMERAHPIGQRLATGLRGLDVAEVRGDGAVWAVRLPEGTSAVATRDRMLEHGVIARPLGDDVIAFCPPLVITDQQLDRCVAALALSLVP
jgi:putrescine---pyruvate transaminase